jgi:predicted  nucleic acid-binding Zn-ribbon protein
MKIKKNGKVINLTESDIKKLSKRILKEETQKDIDSQDNVIHSELKIRVDMLENDVTTNGMGVSEINSRVKKIEEKLKKMGY